MQLCGSENKMTSSFDADQYPGRPKILFIGLANSSHTHSWIDLLKDERFNVRLFPSSDSLPPEEWKVKTYVTSYDGPALDPTSRMRLFRSGKIARLVDRKIARFRGQGWNVGGLSGVWLSRIINAWRPDIVHTLGLESAGEFYFGVRQSGGVAGIGKWVLQLRGGSDLQLAHLDPQRVKQIAPVLRSCDQLLSDNQQNFRIAREMGLREEQLSHIGTVPGTGGIDVESQASKWKAKPSQRRMILWPKAYECPWSKALPVYEALRLCWERIQPCELRLLVMTPETRMYYWTLPEHIRRRCIFSDRVPRAEVLDAMTGARVMLAPSLVDGTPNSMFEAMASGALPIVSPLETIRGVVEAERNVLFARNLYPEEIAAALVRAMTDDALVDEASERNLELVRRVAGRDGVRPRVVGFYRWLAERESQ